MPGTNPEKISTTQTGAHEGAHQTGPGVPEPATLPLIDPARTRGLMSSEPAWMVGSGDDTSSTYTSSSFTAEPPLPRPTRPRVPPAPPLLAPAAPVARPRPRPRLLPLASIQWEGGKAPYRVVSRQESRPADSNLEEPKRCAAVGYFPAESAA